MGLQEAGLQADSWGNVGLSEGQGLPLGLAQCFFRLWVVWLLPSSPGTFPSTLFSFTCLSLIASLHI